MTTITFKRHKINGIKIINCHSSLFIMYVSALEELISAYCCSQRIIILTKYSFYKLTIPAWILILKCASASYLITCPQRFHSLAPDYDVSWETSLPPIWSLVLRDFIPSYLIITYLPRLYFFLHDHLSLATSVPSTWLPVVRDFSLSYLITCLPSYLITCPKELLSTRSSVPLPTW